MRSPCSGDEHATLRARAPAPCCLQATHPRSPQHRAASAPDTTLRRLCVPNICPPPQDGIDFPVKPACLTPGEAWGIIVRTHLESVDTADLHGNLQIGTGGDDYLGEPPCVCDASGCAGRRVAGCDGALRR
jgi:hypothetical protein